MTKHLTLVSSLAAVCWTLSARPMNAQTVSFFRQLSTTSMQRAAAVAADASGVYVVGNTPLRPGGPYQGAVRKYDAQGNELWTREFSVPASAGAQLTGAAADGAGVYVIGYLRSAPGGNNVSSFVRRYSAGGDELWTRQIDAFPTIALAADATGVYLAQGPSVLHKYGVDGAELWTGRASDGRFGDALGVAVDATGIYILGSGAGFFVRKWDGAGHELWTRELGPPADRASNPELIAAAIPTGFFVAGGNGDRTFLRKYDADGSALWSRSAAASYGNLYLAGVTADESGVYVAGFTPLSGLVGQCRSGSGGDSFVRKFDQDGAALWTRQFGTTDAAWANGVAVDGSGVYVAGTTGTPQLEDGLYFHIFPTPGPARGVFLAKLEEDAPSANVAGPRILPDCVVNAASYVGGGVAPGEMVSIFGSAMGSSNDTTRVLFDGVAARLLYVSDTQVTAIVPDAVASLDSVEVQLESVGTRSEAIRMPVLSSRPGIFSVDGSGQGQGAILNEDGSPNSPSNPARRGSAITLKVTGGRVGLPVSAFFDITPSPLGEGEILPIKGEVMSAGSLEIKVRVPANATVTGDAVAFALIVGEQWEAYQVTFALQE